MTSTVPFEGLLSFQEALRKEHNRKILLLEQRRDDEIADHIAERRIAVQKKVLHLRREQEERFLFLSAEKKKDAAASVRLRFLVEFAKIRSECEEEIQTKAETLRSERKSRYVSLLLCLAEEALAIVERPAVVYVAPGDKELLSLVRPSSPLWSEVEIREESVEGWGGCRIVSGKTIVDNTLRTRWRSLSSSFSLQLSRLLAFSFSKIHGRITEL